jgi:hypothetical protein
VDVEEAEEEAEEEAARVQLPEDSRGRRSGGSCSGQRRIQSRPSLSGESNLNPTKQL